MSLNKRLSFVVTMIVIVLGLFAANGGSAYASPTKLRTTNSNIVPVIKTTTIGLSVNCKKTPTSASIKTWTAHNLCGYGKNSRTTNPNTTDTAVGDCGSVTLSTNGDVGGNAKVTAKIDLYWWTGGYEFAYWDGNFTNDYTGYTGYMGNQYNGGVILTWVDTRDYFTESGLVEFVLTDAFAQTNLSGECLSDRELFTSSYV